MDAAVNWRVLEQREKWLLETTERWKDDSLQGMQEWIDKVRVALTLAGVEERTKRNDQEGEAKQEGETV
jgi:hypothetical protein